MSAPKVTPELRALLRRVTLGRCLDTLPERLAHCPGRRLGLATLGRVVRARSDRQGRADRLDSELVTAEARFDEFAETWAERSPAMIDTWRRAWGEFIPFLAFPVELRRVVY